MMTDMTQRCRKFKRSWGSYYAYDNLTGNSVTLKTRDRIEADLKVQAMNETERQLASNRWRLRGGNDSDAGLADLGSCDQRASDLG